MMPVSQSIPHSPASLDQLATSNCGTREIISVPQPVSTLRQAPEQHEQADFATTHPVLTVTTNMPRYPMDVTVIEFTPKSYKEETGESRRCSIGLVLWLSHSKWLVKVTFQVAPPISRDRYYNVATENGPREPLSLHRFWPHISPT